MARTMPRPHQFRAVERDDSQADIFIYGDIGDPWNDSPDSASHAKGFIDAVKNLGDVKQLNIHINSPGGYVFDGVAIHNFLRSHSAKVVVQVDALAASIASVIAMAGDEIRMYRTSQMMIHNPWTVAGGDAAMLRKVAESLDSVRGAISAAYEDKTGIDRKEIFGMMDEETWLSAERAVELGFATEIINAQSPSNGIPAKGRYSGTWRNAPDSIIQAKEVIPYASPREAAAGAAGNLLREAVAHGFD